MYGQQSYIIANIFMVFDAIIMICTGYMAYTTSVELRNGQPVMTWNDLYGILVFLIITNNYLMHKFGFYSERRFHSICHMVRNLSMAVFLSFMFLTGGLFLLRMKPFSYTYLGTYFLLAITLFIMARIALYSFLDRHAHTTINSRNILIAGTGERITPVIDALKLQRSWGHNIAGWVNVDDRSQLDLEGVPNLGALNDFDRILCEYNIDEVIFDLPRDSPIDIKKYLKKCEDIGVVFRIVPDFYHIENSRLKAENIQGIPTLAGYVRPISASSLLYKRMMDILIGSIGFSIFLFLYPFVTLAIKAESPGPVLFKQLRVGLNGRKFYLYKFRSMCVDAESKRESLLVKKNSPWPDYKCLHDPRVTRVGRFIRMTSLDEFPQFINVLKGEMSLVGTRPPTPDEVKYYDDWQRRRISLKPGLTGLWQISGRKEVKDFNEVVRLDLEYIDNYRFINDLQILWKTLWVVMVRKGAK